MELELGINMPSAIALREFADAMPVAIENIVESTERLFQIYNSVAEDVGEHSQDFYNMLMLIKLAQESAVEAINVLPVKLRYTADKIENYLSNGASIDVTSTNGQDPRHQ